MHEKCCKVSDKYVSRRGSETGAMKNKNNSLPCRYKPELESTKCLNAVELGQMDIAIERPTFDEPCLHLGADWPDFHNNSKEDLPDG
eukprot:10674202-Ditylum_brightwellii.AAC.1